MNNGVENNIHSEFFSDFIRGYFDGDGNIFDGSGKPGKRKISFTGTKEFLTWVKNIISVTVENTTGSLYQKRGSSIYRLEYWTHQADKILLFMYDNEYIHLKRKYEKVTTFVSSGRTKLVLQHAVPQKCNFG